jgi:hypothetical protein
LSQGRHGIGLNATKKDQSMTISAELDRYAAHSRKKPPDRLGQRLDAKRFLPESGNTVVCHLDVDNPAHQAVLDARARMQALPEADRFLYTPVESLHMTLFEGVIETRRSADAWPKGVDLQASVASVTDMLLDRLTSFAPLPKFAVRVDSLRPTGLILKGATPEDEARMTAWREALTRPFGYRQAQHDAYRFHMTFCYPIAWLSDAALPVWQAELPAILADLQAAAPIIPLRPAAFCQFNDMTWFEELRVLSYR